MQIHHKNNTRIAVHHHIFTDPPSVVPLQPAWCNLVNDNSSNYCKINKCPLTFQQIHESLRIQKSVLKWLHSWCGEDLWKMCFMCPTFYCECETNSEKDFHSSRSSYYCRTLWNLIVLSGVFTIRSICREHEFYFKNGTRLSLSESFNIPIVNARNIHSISIQNTDALQNHRKCIFDRILKFLLPAIHHVPRRKITSALSLRDCWIYLDSLLVLFDCWILMLFYLPSQDQRSEAKPCCNTNTAQHNL